MHLKYDYNDKQANKTKTIIIYTLRKNRNVQDRGRKETRYREAREKTRYKIVAYKTIKT